MLEREYEYLLQRKSESRYDLYETITKGQKIMIAKFIDLIIFLSGVIYLFITITSVNTISILYAYIGVAVFIVMYFTLKIVLKGMSIGYLLMGLRYVNIRTRKTVTPKEFTDYIVKNMSLEMRPNEIIHTYFNFENRLAQNKPMRKYGLVIVEYDKYNKFVKEYEYNMSRLEEVKAELEKAAS